MLVATPEEAKVLEDIKKAQDVGADPFGDEDDEDVAVTTEDSSIQDDAKDNDESAEAEKPATDESSEVQDDPVEQVSQTQEASPAYQAEVPTDYKDKRSELLKDKAAAMKKLMDGEIDADEFAQTEARISDALEDLTAQRIRAETLLEANKQAAQQYQQKAIQRLISQSKSQIDYAADVKAQRQFDAALTAIQTDPDNAAKDYADLLGEAHKIVLALRGITATKGSEVADAIQKAQRKPEGTPPVTLRNIPAAATANANGDMLEQMSRLSGQEYEAAFARLSPAQRRTLLDE